MTTAGVDAVGSDARPPLVSESAATLTVSLLGFFIVTLDASLPTASTPAVVIVAFLTPHEQAEFDYPLRFYYSSKRMLDVRLA